MMVIENGRPADCSGRLPKEVRAYDLLDSLGITYLRADHEAAMTMEACLEIDNAMGVDMCKNLLLCNRQQTDFYMLLMPGNKPFKTKDLSAQIGSSRLSFASGEQMEQLLDITPGSLCILGLMNDKENRVRLLIDAAVLQEEFFGCHPCINTSSVKMKTCDAVNTLIPALGHTPQIVQL